MKRMTVAVAVLLLLVSLAGCMGEKPAPVTDPLPTTEGAPLIPTTAPPYSATTPTRPTEPTEPPPALEPVTYLSSILWRTQPEFLSLGDGNLLACRNYFEEGSGIVNFLDVVNVYEDQVVAQGRNETPRELVKQNFDDGCFVLADPAENKFYAYNGKLEIVQTISVPHTEGFFSHDRSSYYFLQDRVLYRMDVSTGNYGRMSLQEDLRFERIVSIHPDRDILCLRVYLSFYEEICGFAAIDCTTGSLLVLRDDVEHLWFKDRKIYVARTSEKSYGYDILFGDADSGSLTGMTSSTLGGVNASYSVLPDSGYMVLYTLDEEAPESVLYDLSARGLSCELSRYHYSNTLLDAIYLEQEQLIVGLYPVEYDFAPVVIDPKVLNFTASASMQTEQWGSSVNRQLLSAYQAELEGPELPDALQAQRQRADVLEEKYGIRVLMGQQIVRPCGSYARVEEDPNRIDGALTQLETALSKYPEGFLSQFCNGIHEGGLYFCLTGRLDGALMPVGKTQRISDRYDISIDITADGLERTIHHELWHAAEMKLSTERFAHPQWEACNPEGFVYYGSYDEGYAALTQDTFAQSGAECSFVDAYSKINGTEDRARLMENVMMGDAGEMMRSPVLKKKLDIMSQTLREHFDTKDWNTPLWEQYE